MKTPCILTFNYVYHKMFSLRSKTHLFTKYAFCSLFSAQNTIYALSSGTSTAISVYLFLYQVVRVSGPYAYQVLNLLKAAPPAQSMSRLELLSKYRLTPKQMTLRSIYSPDKGLIDKCLLVYFEANHSYSG